MSVLEKISKYLWIPYRCGALPWELGIQALPEQTGTHFPWSKHFLGGQTCVCENAVCGSGAAGYATHNFILGDYSGK